MAASLPFQSAINVSSFTNQLQSHINQVKLYENKSNQLQALSCVPVDDLRAIAQAKYDSSEKPEGTPTEESNVVKDMLLLELMDWFKTEFFTWMNSPSCPRCNKPTQGIGSGAPTAMEKAKSAGNVELYTCSSCCPDRREIARFPRYNNPAILLETRQGRCGEWAHCFALICRAVGFEVRQVFDSTDHVWVEIYSSSLNPNRWVHADPCENSYDNPLLYEVGWGKKLCYIIAVSHDDIQDVTPRYSKDFKSVLARRNSVDETWLVSTMLNLRKQMQQHVTEARRAELQQRWICEIVELLTANDKKEIKDGEKTGRDSGSLAWRLARQELGIPDVANPTSNFVWKVGQNSIFNGEFELNYDANLDAYFTKNKAGQNDKSIVGWQNGVFLHEDIFRKEEHDWKMVYLATTENSKNQASKICWKFETDPGYTFEGVQIKVQYSIFQSDAKFSLRVITDDATIKNVLETNSGDTVYSWKSKSPPEDSNFNSLLQRSKTVTVVCELKNGSGNLGWQKAQLFRQQVAGGKSLNSNILNISFNMRKT